MQSKRMPAATSDIERSIPIAPMILKMPTTTSDNDIDATYRRLWGSVDINAVPVREYLLPRKITNAIAAMMAIAAETMPLSRVGIGKNANAFMATRNIPAFPKIRAISKCRCFFTSKVLAAYGLGKATRQGLHQGCGHEGRSESGQNRHKQSKNKKNGQHAEE